MKIFVIVVTYNGEKWIQKCLDSLTNSSISNSVIVVDNNSSDLTVDIVVKDYPSVSLIETGKNVGFGKANNIGIEIAIKENADFVLLLNQDAWVEKTTIEQLVKASIEYTDFGVISPFHLNYEGNDVENYFKKYVLAYYTLGYFQDYENNSIKPIYQSTFIHAACWLLPMSTIQKVGGFDPLFFHYGEDNDFVQRLADNQLKIGFLPNAIFYHYGTNEGLSNTVKSFRFRVNEIALNFKNPKASEIGAFLLFFKHSFKLIFASLNKRNIEQFGFELKVFWFNLKRIGRIIKSRKLQKKEYAFLQVNTK